MTPCGIPLCSPASQLLSIFAAYPGTVTLSKRGRKSGPEQPSVHFQVYALRERGTGTIVLVGRRIPPDDDAHDNIDALTALRSSPERPDDLELVLLAQRVGDPEEAIRIENAVVSAYRAARLTPARSAAANTVCSDPNGAAGRPNGADPSAAGAIPSHAPDFLDGGHRQRLEDLILRQHQEIAELNEALDRVRALRELQQWADGAGHVRVSDLDRALGLAN